jgi:predicted CXXCH cytochrome family protein
MRCLIRRVVKRGKDSLEYRDSDIETDSVTIGWASDQAITLAGPDIDACHARIRRRLGGGLEIQAVSAAQVRVNGAAAKAAALKAGDVIEIGVHRLSVLERQPGFDLVLLVQPGKVDESAVQSAGGSGRKQVGAGWLTRSRLAWILTLGVVLITFAVPVAGLFSEPLRQLLRENSLLPSDALWDTGPLAAAHRTPDIGSDCNVCHRHPFRQVENRVCHDCHKSMTQHVSDDSGIAGELSARRCTTCHKEHKEPGQIVRRDQALCVDCHADESAMRDDAADLAPVGDFGSDHPSFRLSMWQLQSAQTGPEWLRHKVAMSEQPPHEQSNLKFNHKVHLEPEGVDTVDGRVVMACSDCHAEDAAGALMRPFTMAGECRRCHSLNFDEHAPDREVPHGSVREVIATLEEYYSKLALEDNPEISRRTGRIRETRRPGRDNNRSDPDTVLAWARRQARLAAEDMLERSVCDTCHEVQRNEGEGDAAAWTVLPVRVNRVWMPASTFTHRTHSTEPCGDCHEADDSEHSTDVLMPDIDVCRNCHGGVASQAKIGSRCVDCHDFHNPNMGPLYAEHHAGTGQTTESPIEEASGQ